MNGLTENNPARPEKGRVFLSGKIKIPSLNGHLIFWSVLVAGLAADLFSKQWVFQFLKEKPENQQWIFKPVLQFITALNDGAAFSIASGQRYMLVAVSSFAFVAVIIAFMIGLFKKKWMLIVMAMLAAGIAGNLYDRIFNDGAVRDFISVTYFPGVNPWPTFNIADSLLCIGVGILIIMSFIDKPDQIHDLQQTEEPSTQHQQQ